VRPGPRGSAGAHLDREARSGAEEHVAAPEPTSLGRRGPELRNMWWRRSSTQQRDEARGHEPHGSTGAHLSMEVRSGATRHVAALKPNSAGRYGPKLQLTWQYVDARHTSYLDLELVCGGTRCSGCRHQLVILAIWLDMSSHVYINDKLLHHLIKLVCILLLNAQCVNCLQLT
jgi:hypothetical protein